MLSHSKLGNNLSNKLVWYNSLRNIVLVWICLIWGGDILNLRKGGLKSGGGVPDIRKNLIV